MSNEISATSIPQEIELKIKTAIELKKELERYEREIKDDLLKAMQDNDIVSIKNDSYTISLAHRATYSSKTSDIPAQFAKTVLDTSKVSTHEKLYGTVPEGIDKKVTDYVTWRAK